MLDTTLVITGKTLNYKGELYKIESAGILNDEPYATVSPENEVVVQTILKHIRKFMPLPFSLDEIQNELS